MAGPAIKREDGFYVLEQNVNGFDVRAQYSKACVERILLPLLREWTELRRRLDRRILVFLAAPPGAGKSTLANFLQALSRQAEGVEPVEAIGMDGFHRFQEYLLTHTVARDGKQVPMVCVKGAPVTFDLPKLAQRIRQLKTDAVCPWPLYDRKLHDPVEGKIAVSGGIVLLEGNYLLLEAEGWRDLKRACDYSVRILADEGQLRERLIQRKMLNGIARPEAEAFVDGSDLVNARLCARMQAADLTLRLTDSGEYVRADAAEASRSGP